MSDHDHGHDPGMAPEGDPTPAGLLIVLIFIVFGFMAVAIAFITPIVNNEAHNLKWYLQMEDAGRLEADLLAVEQDKLLSSYKQNDDGSWAVPVATAKETVLANPALLTGEWNVTVAAAEEPAVAVDPLVAQGEKLYTAKICMTCHSVDGSRLVGPSFKGLVGRTEKLADGSSVVADKAYIRESIYEPNAKVVEGYPPAMPPVAGGLTDEEFEALYAYLASLSDTAPTDDGATEAAADEAAAEGEAAEGEAAEGEAAEGEAVEAAAEGEAAEGDAVAAVEDPAAAVVADGAATGSVELGSQLYTAKGCVACHTLDGSKGLGPSWKGAWGRAEKLTDGTTVTVDEAYLRSSILNPTAQIVEGYAPVMPPVPGGVTDEELAALVAFIKAQ